MMTKCVIQTERAPAAIGPYSQAIRVGQLVFCSGQIALDPETNQIAEGGVKAETHQVLKNLTAVLAQTGLDLGHVVKTTIYLASMTDFAEVNEVYSQYFRTDPPARATVAVAGLPKGVRVEIDAIAAVP
jgi:2-iminobutanoate/2-iminopropanoate deaminase